MKQVLFILLLYISFQGFSQSVKVPEIGLEVMTKDLGQMNWENAKKSCADLGDGWRLPTIQELRKIYPLRYKIGGFLQVPYWSSTDGVTNTAWFYGFYGFDTDTVSNKYRAYYVRAVRDLK